MQPRTRENDMKTVKLLGTSALALMLGVAPVMAEMTAVGDGEGEVSIVAWAGYIERGEIRPLVADTFPLERIADAQRAFLEKRHVGKLVLLPPVATRVGVTDERA